MSHPFLILSQSDCLIEIVDINSDTNWLTEQIQISWLLQKPTDLDLPVCKGRAYLGSAGQGLILLPIFSRIKLFEDELQKV